MTAERAGVPAVAVMTEAFVSAAQMMAAVQGVPDYPFVVIAHPISSATDAQLAKQAERAVARGVEILRDRV